MAYSLHKSDGTLVTVADNAISTDFYNPAGGSGSPPTGTGIRLIGRNAIDYGVPVAESFLQLTENFSSTTGTQPVGGKALQGQLWYDKSLSTMYVRITPGTAGADGMVNWSKFITVPGSQTGTVPITNPTPGSEKDGDILVTGTGPTTIISIWGGGAWRRVYPGPVVNPNVGSEKDGDIAISGTNIGIWAAGNWRIVSPAIYS